jgi:hypothetical protein
VANLDPTKIAQWARTAYRLADLTAKLGIAADVALAHPQDRLLPETAEQVRGALVDACDLIAAWREGPDLPELLADICRSLQPVLEERTSEPCPYVGQDLDDSPCGSCSRADACEAETNLDRVLRKAVRQAGVRAETASHRGGCSPCAEGAAPDCATCEDAPARIAGGRRG